MEEQLTMHQMVCLTLQYANSQDVTVLKQAEQKLAEWEIQPGFYLTLMNIITNHQIDLSIRWMGAVYLKNCIQKYWRNTAKNAIEGSEKNQIKLQLLMSYNEPNPQLAVLFAEIISRISRFDYPQEWADLIPTLMEGIESADPLQQHRALLILLKVLKALSSKCLYLYREQTLDVLSQKIYSHILNLWDGFTNLYFQSVQENRECELSMNYLEKATLTLRMLRVLTIYTNQKPHLKEDCMLFIDAIFRRCKESLECRYELRRRQSSTSLIDLTEKFILKQMKFLNAFLERHPLSFCNYINTSIEFSFNYVFYTGTNLIYDDNVINFSQFAIHCMNLMKGVITSQIYHNEIEYEFVVENGELKNVSKSKFFTNERLSYICEKFIEHYFPLTQQELDLWAEDPETFEAGEISEGWKYSLRDSATTLFATLLIKFTDPIIKEVFKYIKKSQAIELGPDSDLKDILLKDSIYTAAGLIQSGCHEEFDFKSWFAETLLKEIQIKTDNFKILRRRIIWLISFADHCIPMVDWTPMVEWTPMIDCTSGSDVVKNLFHACIELLHPQEDMAVRLEASRTLKHLLCESLYNSHIFALFVEVSFSALFVLLKDAKECETKMKVLYDMTMIIDKTYEFNSNTEIKKHTDNLISYLPLLWRESEDHNMLRSAIIVALTSIVKSVYSLPSSLLTFLYQIIDLTTDIKNQASVYLMEDGLELWLKLMHNSPHLPDKMLSLCKNLLPIIEMSSEYLRTIIEIIQSYVVLSGEVYLRYYGKDVVSACAYLMNDMKEEGIIKILRLFELFLIVSPEYSVELLEPVLPFIFKQACTSADALMTSRLYLCIVARILFINQRVFYEKLQESEVDMALERLLDVWINKMPIMKYDMKLKILSLALGSILTVDNKIIHDRFPGILQSIFEALDEIMVEENNVLVDSQVNDDDTPNDDDLQGSYYIRLSAINHADIGHKISLNQYIQAQLTQLKQILGDERYQSLMLTVDPSILQNLSLFLNIYIEIPKPSLKIEDTDICEKLSRM